MSNGVHCLVSGHVNKENMPYRTTVNRRELHEQPFQSPKVAVWCAMGTSLLWVRFYLKMVTVRALQSLLSVTSRFCTTACFHSCKYLVYCTFQQDGDVAHTAGRSAKVVRSLFHSVISRFGDIHRPVLSRSLRSQISFCGHT